MVENLAAYQMADKSENYKKLDRLCHAVKASWLQDCDKTNEMREIIDLNNEIINSNSIEEYFAGNKVDILYYMNEFMQETINNILLQPVVYGEDGDEVALEVLLSFIKIFLKFHKKKEYEPINEKIRTILNQEQSISSYFLPSSGGFQSKIKNDKKFYSAKKYNSIFNQEYLDPNKTVSHFQVGDIVDILVNYENSKHSLDKKAWVQGKIINIVDNNYIIDYGENSTETIDMDDFNILPKGTKTKDWEWRQNLQPYDILDCYDRSKWYPASIIKREENVNSNGVKKVVYKIGFRLYIDKYKNPNDEKEDISKQYVFWENEKTNQDSNEEFYIGDKEGFDEVMTSFSKRIQKFETFTSIQRNYLNSYASKNYSYDYSYNNYYNGYNNIEMNPLQLKTNKLENDCPDFNPFMDDYYLYEKDGHKNYIIGKTQCFSYYYALLLKGIADLGGYEEFINILKDKPNSEEIFTIFFIIYCSINFLHREYFIENSKIFKESILKYINNLDNKEMRNIPKYLLELLTRTIMKIDERIKEVDSNNENYIDLFEEITLSFSLKMIKTSIFDKRLQGVKALNEHLIKNKDNEKIINNIITLLKKNDIINEIFGSNYHSQIISKSNDIIEILLRHDQLTEQEMRLIWDCSQRGDLEAKVIILNLLSEVAKNLNEKYIRMLLNNIIENTDFSKNNQKELELVFKLCTQNNNKEILKLCCEFFCKCVLTSNAIEKVVAENQAMKYLIQIIDQYKYDELIKCCIDICINSLNNNKNALFAFTIIVELLDKDYSEYIKELINSRKLLDITENNFRLYKKQIKENNNNLIIDGYDHITNIKKRMEFYIKIIKYYSEYNFMDFLKSFLLKDSITEEDSKIYYEFMNNYINKCVYMKARKDIQENIFNFFKNDKKKNITKDEFSLFTSVFYNINKEKGNILYEYNNNLNNVKIKVKLNKDKKIENLEGLNILWNIIFEIKDEGVLNKGIEMLIKIYNENMNELLDKCTENIKNNNNNISLVEKCLKILKLIILESEKNYIVTIKPHRSLLKDSFLALNIYLNKNNNELGVFNSNTSIIEYKEALAYMNDLPVDSITISAIDNKLEKKVDRPNTPSNNNKVGNKNSPVADNSNLKKEEIIIGKEYGDNKPGRSSSICNVNPYKALKSDDNNKTLVDLELINDITDKLSSKLEINYKEKEGKLADDKGNLTEEFKNILREKFKEWSDEEGHMTSEFAAIYVKNVTRSKDQIAPNDKRIERLITDHGEGKDYLTFEEFAEFYRCCLKEPKKVTTVWENINAMGYRKDLKQFKDIVMEVIDKEKLPRYNLGNDINLINLLEKMYLEIEDKNRKKNISEFLFDLGTNNEIFNKVINNDKILDNIFSNNKNYLEQLYILIIIMSIFQDVALMGYNLDNLFVEDEEYKYSYMNNILNIKNNKTDNDNDKKIEFIKNFIINGNYSRLISYIQNLLLIKEDDNIKNKCCEISIKLINIIFKSTIGKSYTTEFNNLKMPKSGIYNISYNYIYSIINNSAELTSNISYIEFAKSLIKYLKNTNNDLLMKICFSMLIDLIGYSKNLINELLKDNKEELTEIIQDRLTSGNEEDKSSFLEKLINTIENKDNKEFIIFLFEITHDLFNKIIINKNDNNNNNKINNSATSFVRFFEYFNKLYDILEKINGNSIKEMNNNQIIFKIYDNLFNNMVTFINDKGQKNKDVIIGLFNIIIKTINDENNNNDNNKDNNNDNNTDNNDNSITYKIITRKINDLTLFSLILKKIFVYSSEELNSDNNLINTSSNKFVLIPKNQESTDDSLIPIEIKHKCFEYISSCLKNFNSLNYINYLTILKSTLDEIDASNSNSNGKDSDDEYGYRYKGWLGNNSTGKSCGHVGLKNLGCICYMNSIMQQIYMIPTFRYAVLYSDDKEEPKTDKAFSRDDNLLHQLQKMYSYLTFSEKVDYNPKDFCYSFKDFDGNPTNPMVQQDSQEFYNNFCDKVENSMKKTKLKYSVNDVFTGRTCSSVICETCQTVSNRFEDFYNLTLEVKNINSLDESLLKLVVPEKIDEFNCEVCKKKVTINKRTSLADLPNVLVVHLKRFYMNYEIERTEKINSKFEFPKTLNLKHFCIEEIAQEFKKAEYETDDIYLKKDDYYEYILKGINVHIGSADGGHYFSFIDVDRDGKGNVPDKQKFNKNWLKFNDSNVSKFDIEEIPKECYGGVPDGSLYNYENSQNAYLLLYERKIKTPIRIIIDKEEIDKNEEIINYNKDTYHQIKKKYDISKLHSDISESSLYKIVFHDNDKDEYYKYIPYYDQPRYVPREIYMDVLENNKKFKKKQTKENDLIKNKDELNKSMYMQLLKIKNLDLASNKITLEDKYKILAIIFDNIFSNYQGLQGEEIDIYNNNIDKIFNNLLIPATLIYDQRDIIYRILDYIKSTQNLEKIYTLEKKREISPDNINNFTTIIKNIYNALDIYNDNKNKEDLLKKLLEVTNNTSFYIESIYMKINADKSRPTKYLYEFFNEILKKDSLAVQVLNKEGIISNFFSKIEHENKENNLLIYECIHTIIKKSKEHHVINYDEEGESIIELSNELKKKDNVDAKLIRTLFLDNIDLCIDFVRLLEWDCDKMTEQLDLDIINYYNVAKTPTDLFNVLKLAIGILSIPDDIKEKRYPVLLGNPTMICEFKNNEEDDKVINEEDYDEIYPLFGTRLMNKNIKTNIYKYINDNHIYENNCILAYLLPYTENIDDLKDNEILTVEERQELIFKIIMLCTKDSTLYKYLYLLPARSLHFNNVLDEFKYILSTNKNNKFDEIFNILEKQNKDRIENKIRSIEDIFLQRMNNESKYDNTECDTENPLGFICNMIPDEIDREEATLIASGQNLFLLKFEYFTTYRTIEDIKTNGFDKVKLEGNNKTSTEEIKEEDKKAEKIKISDVEKEVKLDNDTENNNNDADNNTANNDNKANTANNNENKDNTANDNMNNPKSEDPKSNNEQSPDEEEGSEPEESKKCSPTSISTLSRKQFNKSEYKFLIRIINELNKGFKKVIIPNKKQKKKKNIKTTLIRYVLISTQKISSNLVINIRQGGLNIEIKSNYYVPIRLFDRVPADGYKDILILNRFRKELPFIKTEHIGINIDVKGHNDF